MMSTRKKDLMYEGRNKYDLDVDRMVNEGLGGGRTEVENGYIGQTISEQYFQQKQRTADEDNK